MGRRISNSISITTVYDGVDAIRIDLDNEADIIACDSTGKVRFARTITTNVRLYDGASPVKSGLSITVSAIKLAGITPTVSAISSTTGAITVSWAFTTSNTLSNASYSVSIPLTYNSVTYTALFTLTRTDATAIYQLVPSLNEVSFGVDANNDYTPSSIQVTCGYTVDTGTPPITQSACPTTTTAIARTTASTQVSPRNPTIVT